MKEIQEGKNKFEAFLAYVDSENQKFVIEINDFLLQNNCNREIKDSKNGYTVSYRLNKNKRTLTTFVLRKIGVKLRILPEHINQYADFLDTLPENVKKDIRKASVCKRLINPKDCNARCVKGYDFYMDREHYQKCRYMAFMPTLSAENNPYIKTFLEKELIAQGIE
jgi:hypothetical protein